MIISVKKYQTKNNQKQLKCTFIYLHLLCIGQLMNWYTYLHQFLLPHSAWSIIDFSLYTRYCALPPTCPAPKSHTHAMTTAIAGLVLIFFFFFCFIFKKFLLLVFFFYSLLIGQSLKMLKFLFCLILCYSNNWEVEWDCSHRVWEIWFQIN